MGEDDDPDSESGVSEFRQRVARRRGRHVREARVCHSFGMSMSSQDPMPEYVDPELLKLIAQNAPFELDVFERSLNAHARRRAENDGARRRTATGDDRRSLAVDVPLSSVTERNEDSSARKNEKEIRHSCPEPLWTDFDNEEDTNYRGKAMMRKRRRGSYVHQTSANGKEVGREEKLRKSARADVNDTREADVESDGASAGSSNQGFDSIENEGLRPSKPNASDLSPAIHAALSGNNCEAVNARPWRHGMRKSMLCTKDVENQPEATCCKRKADPDSRKTVEVRKYIETKETERRKEQLQLKANARAALAARKERQRKLDLHRQALLQSHVKIRRSRKHSLRPAWISEYNGVGEHPRPWSASSSAECNNIRLPPPMTPPKLEPLPLDLYTTQVQYEEQNPPSSRLDEELVHHRRHRRRPRHVIGCRREVQKQLKYREYELAKAFPDKDVELAAIPEPCILRNARWEGSPRPKEKILPAVDLDQLQLAEIYGECLRCRSTDLEVYKKSLRRQFYGNVASLGRTAKAYSRAHRASKRPSRNTRSTSMAQAESSAKFACKGHGPLPSKRRKPSEPVVVCKAEEFTARELATMLNGERVRSDCESDYHIPDKGRVIADRFSLRQRLSPSEGEQEKYAHPQPWGGSVGSSSRNVMDEGNFLKLVGPSSNLSETLVTDEDGPQKGRNLFSESLGLTMHDEVQTQLVGLAEGKANRIHGRNTDNRHSTGVVQRQRMHMLKNVVEHLMKRVNVACAKKRQFERSVMDHSDGQSLDPRACVQSDPLVSLNRPEAGQETKCVEAGRRFLHKQDDDQSSLPEAEELQVNKLLESELGICLPAVNSNFLSGRLTEQEQAGCDVALGQRHAQQATVKSSVTSHCGSKALEVLHDTSKASPTSGMCAAMDWSVASKPVDVTCNIPSACSSFGPSSSSTGSSSPVILPTNLKYHRGRVRYRKLVAKKEHTEQTEREYWGIPEDKDKHSIINLYTEHLKKERERLRTVTKTDIVQCHVEDGTEGKIKTVSAGGGYTAEAEGNHDTVASAPQLGDLELQSNSQESVALQTGRRSADFCHGSKRTVGNAAGVVDFKIEQEFSPSKFERQKIPKSTSDKSMTLHDTAHKGDMHRVGNSDTQIPEVTLVEIGDLKLSQSRTSLHLRFEDKPEGRNGAEQVPVTFNHLSKRSNLAGSTAVSGSKKDCEGPFFTRLIPPMKITYARRFRSRSVPEDGSADDERVVVEVQQMGGPMKSRIGEKSSSISELEPSEGSVTAESTFPRNEVFETWPSDIGEGRAAEMKTERQTSTKFRKNGGSQSASLTSSARPFSDVEEPHQAPPLEEPVMQATYETNMTNFSDLNSKFSTWNLDVEEQCNTGVGRRKHSSKQAHSMEGDDEGRGDVKHKCSRHARRKGKRNEKNIRLAAEDSNDLKANPHVDFEDVEEQALRLRRNQLEAELQRLDAQIMKTRAKLQRNHPMINDQLHSASNNFSTNQPVAKSVSLHETSTSVGRQSICRTVRKQQHGDADQRVSDSQLREPAYSLVNQASSMCEEKKVSTSICCDGLFASENIAVAYQLVGIEDPTSPRDHCLKQKSKISSSVRQSIPSREYLVSNVLKDNGSGHHQSDVDQISVRRPHWRETRMADEFPGVELDNSCGRVPPRKHGQPSQLYRPEDTAVSPVVASVQMDDDHRSMPSTDVASPEVSNEDDRGGCPQASVGAIHSPGRWELWKARGEVSYEKERFTQTMNKAQILSEHHRKLREHTEDCREVLEFIKSDLHESDSQIAEKGNGWMSWGTHGTVGKPANVGIATGSNFEQDKINIPDTAKEVASSLDRKDVILCATVASTFLQPDRYSENSIEGSLCGLPPIEDEKPTAETKVPRSSSLVKTCVDSLGVFSELPSHPIPPTKANNSGIEVIDSVLSSRQASETTVSKLTDVCSQDCPALVEKEFGRLPASEGKEISGRAENLNIADEVSQPKPHDTGLKRGTSSNSVSGTEVTAECQSLPAEMGISAVKEALGIKKLELVKGLKANDVLMHTENAFEPFRVVNFDQSKAKIEHLHATEAPQDGCSFNTLTAASGGVETFKRPSTQSKLDNVRGSSSGERFSFLQHLKPPKADFFAPEIVESPISEDLEDCQSDIAEDLQCDVDDSPGWDIQSQSRCNSPLPGNDCVSECHESGFRVKSESLGRLVSDQEPVLSVADTLPAQRKYAGVDITANGRDKLQNHVPNNGASTESKMPRSSDSPGFSHGGVMMTSCASRGVGEPEVAETPKISGTVNSDIGSLFGSLSGNLHVATHMGLSSEVGRNDEIYNEESARPAQSFFSNAKAPVTSSKSNSVELVASLPMCAEEPSRAASVVRDISDAIWSRAVPSKEDDLQEKGIAGNRLHVDAKSSCSPAEYISPKAIQVSPSDACPSSRELSLERDISLVPLFNGRPCTKGLDVQMADGRDACRWTSLSGVQGGVSRAENFNESCLHAFPLSIPFPRQMMEGCDKISCFERLGQGSLCSVDEENMCADRMPRQQQLDSEASQLQDRQNCQKGPLQEVAKDSSDQIAQKEVQYSLIENHEEKGHISDGACKLLDEFAESSEHRRNAVEARDCPGGEVICSSMRLDRLSVGLGELSSEGVQNVVAPWVYPSRSTGPSAGNDRVTCRRESPTDSKKKSPVEGQSAETIWPATFGDSSSIEVSRGDLRACPHSKVLVTEDFEYPLGLGGSGQLQTMSLGTDQMMPLMPCKTNPIVSSPPALCHEGAVFNLPDVADDQCGGTMPNELNFKHECLQAEEKHERRVNITSEMTSNVHSLVSSAEVGYTVEDLRNCDRSVWDHSNCCSIEVDVLSESRHRSPNDGTKKKSEAPFGSNVVIGSQNGQISDDRRDPLVSDREESTFGSTLDDFRDVDCKQTSSISVAPREEVPITSPLGRIHEESGQVQLDGILKNIRRELDTSRAQRQNVIAGMVTDMLFDDLLMEELSGHYHEGGRPAASQKKCRQSGQTVNFSRSLAPKAKRIPRKDSDFCAVLKYFLPAGWRCASKKHKDGSFLHVNGLKPHPLSLVTKSMLGPPLKLSGGQCLRHGEFEINPRSRGSEPLLLYFDDVYLCVRRIVEHSKLAVDRILSNGYNAKSPESEHISGLVDEQASQTSHMQIHKLLFDLTNESLRQQWSLVPFMTLKTVPWPTSSERLVGFITNGILERQRHALKHGFDIDKSIAKVFDDEDRERCSNEVQDVVADLTQGILGDVIERLVLEMMQSESADQRHSIVLDAPLRCC